MSNELEEPEADTSEGGWEEAACPGENGALGPEEDAMEAGLVEEVEAQVDPSAAAFAAFAARVARRPQQVLRYCFEEGARPLWPSPDCTPGDIPPCPYCGAPRRFEFQVGWRTCRAVAHCVGAVLHARMAGVCSMSCVLTWAPVPRNQLCHALFCLAGAAAAAELARHRRDGRRHGLGRHRGVLLHGIVHAATAHGEHLPGGVCLGPAALMWLVH